MTQVMRTLTTVDISDKRNPKRSGRYVSLIHLLALVGEMRENDTPMAELERVLREAAGR